MQKHILKSLVKQSMAGKTVRLNWEEWQEYCLEHELNPRKTCEDSRDLGGGDSYEVVCIDEPPKEEHEEPTPTKLQNCKCQIIVPEEEL